VPEYGTWFSYGGDARIWLAVVLLAVAVGLVCAGIWLPLPAMAATPSRKAVVTTLAALIVEVVAWLVCVGLYVRRYLAAYHLPASKAAPPDHIAPITVLAVIVVFVVIIIVTNSSLAGWVRLASAAVGAVAAPLIFELPFDLVVMTRTYPPIPPDPALYRVIFFAPLFLIEITTLLLLRLSPIVRLTRATFISLALMFAVFAGWALDGFGYPFGTVPTALNIASKLLAFVAVLTLFLPRQPPVTTSTPVAAESAAAG
jgi:hypothetical protein